MNIKKSSIIILLVIFFTGISSYAQNAEQEKITAQGKIVSGLSQEEALNKYGVPSAANDLLWYYAGLEKLYVYLKRPLKVYLYPRFCKGSAGVPLELKVYAGLQEITDVTSQSELLLSEPGGFSIVGQGVVVPKKSGDYQIIAVYKGVHSNPCFVSIPAAKDGIMTVEEEKLINIDIFPDKPYVNPDSVVYFSAYGTFVFKDRYSIREITRQVEWYKENNGSPSKLKDSNVEFVSPGRSKVFCKYKGVQSIPQDVEVVSVPVQLNRNLKHVSVIPANIYLAERTSMPFLAVATYEDNSVEEVTKRVNWSIKDQAILERDVDNIFMAKLVGITEVQGVLENIRSLPTKVAVSSTFVEKEKADNSKPQKKELNDLFEEIKDDIKDLNKKVTEEIKYKYIKIVPNYCDICVGDKKQLIAFGVRQDNSEEDITILAKWEILDTRLASVKVGLVNGLAVGETQVCVGYKNIENQCIPVMVREAKLVSIAVTPTQLKIVIGAHSSLKAEGYYGDESHKDITLLANWVGGNSEIAKIGKNSVLAVRAGRTEIYAEYLGIRSLPVEVVVVKEKYWLLKFIAKIILLLFLILLLVLVLFFILAQKEKEQILNLYSNPRNFIIALYRNFNKIMAIFGLPHKFYMPPLFFAGLVDEKYALKDKLFLKFTQRYEEAKYSLHTFPPETSLQALDAYNHILMLVFAQYKKRTFIYRYLMAMVSKVPLFISKDK